MLKKLSLQFKLILAFLVIVLSLTVASFYQIRALQRFNSLYLDLVDNDFVRLETLLTMQSEGLRIRNTALDYRAATVAADHDETAATRSAIVDMVTQLRDHEQQYRQLVEGDTAHSDLGRLNELSQLVDQVATQAQLVAADTGSGPGGGLSALATKEAALAASQAKLDKYIQASMKEEERAVDRYDGEVDQTLLRAQTVTVGVTFMNIVLALALGLLLASWISRALTRVRKGAEYIANGDFLHPIPVTSQDDLGKLSASFNHMAERLRDAYRRQAIAQQRDEAMLLGMGEGLIALDAAGKVTLMNKIAADLFGLPNTTAAIGKPVQEIYQLYPIEGKAEEPLPPAQRPGLIALQTGAPVSGVYGLHNAGGQKYLLSITASPVKVEGRVVGAITVLRDVTKEKEVDRMKTEFISLASHQLRTPLSAIKWYSEMLMAGDAGELQPDQADFARNIAESTERMIDLVNALLNISRIESGRILVDPKPTDLKELVSGIVNDLKAKIEGRQQNLIISVNDGLPKINLDPRLIGQVYMNLLTNAIKYTPKGGEISVFISRKDDQIISQVTDNGYGIPKEQQAHIFQKFFRAANAVKVETDGTGLGLYLIKAIVESSGGKIWFASDEGKGTTFWFTMPMSGMKPKAGEVTLDG